MQRIDSPRPADFGLRRAHLGFALAGVLVLATPAAGEPREYRDYRGAVVALPLGDLSFADTVVSFEAGNPGAKFPESAEPGLSLGAPDYRNEGEDAPPRATTLGCGGVLVLRFDDNALVDGEGADLHVFEIGPDVEATELAISEDGRRWIEVGRIAGGKAAVDIAAVAQPEDSYRYVRLTDGRQACGSRWPGADIDSVAAVGSAYRLSLDSAVLFDFDKSELRPEARGELDRLAGELQALGAGAVTIEGHTDARGSDAYNQRLSEARAASVRAYLLGALGDGVTLRARGRGESQPVDTNSTDAGRQRNRRVEVIVRTAAKASAPAAN